MEEETHVHRLPDGCELLHQFVIEADEMLLLKRLDDRVGQAHRAGFYRVARKFPALEDDLRENRERVFDKASLTLFEISGYERSVDLIERS